MLRNLKQTDLLPKNQNKAYHLQDLPFLLKEPSSPKPLKMALFNSLSAVPIPMKRKKSTLNSLLQKPQSSSNSEIDISPQFGLLIMRKSGRNAMSF